MHVSHMPSVMMKSLQQWSAAAHAGLHLVLSVAHTCAVEVGAAVGALDVGHKWSAQAAHIPLVCRNVLQHCFFAFSQGIKQLATSVLHTGSKSFRDVGDFVGCALGSLVGTAVGSALGATVGTALGAAVGVVVEPSHRCRSSTQSSEIL